MSTGQDTERSGRFSTPFHFSLQKERMPSHPQELYSETETDIAYWRDRVSSLELLVVELLAKNQALRSALRSVTHERPSAGAFDETQ